MPLSGINLLAQPMSQKVKMEEKGFKISLG
jgi:hypothetical protein